MRLSRCITSRMRAARQSCTRYHPAPVFLQEFNTKPSQERSVYVVDFVEKTTANLSAKNPNMAQQIRDWFSRKQEGKPYSEGLERLYVELTALELLGREGKADLSKIQVEGVVVKVIKGKFPPPPK